MLSGVLGRTVAFCSALSLCGAVYGQTTLTAGEHSGDGSVAANSAESAPQNTAGEGSQVRIVRLSQARGTVRMDRNTGRGYEVAFNNMPVVAGARLQTGQGVAEVEFEDNSSLRLVPGSSVRFVELSRTAAGATVTRVDVLEGVVYLSLEKTKGNDFLLTHGTMKIAPEPGAHLRLDADSPAVEVSAFDGIAAITLGSATTVLRKNQTVTVDPAAGTASAVAQGVAGQDFDPWDKQEQRYHHQAASFAGNGSGMYGTSDLNYYGSFVDMPGCGTMWRPYFANAAWDPFSNGIWAWYPAAGYSWVSPYPWGWLPFHSGEWASCGGAGWGWRPSGTFIGLKNHHCLEPGGHPRHPLPPGQPGKGVNTLIPVNLKPLTFSGASESEKFMFRQNSAGLGVPRDFGSLHSLSAHVDRKGEAQGGMRNSPLETALAVPSWSRTPSAGTVRTGGGRSSSFVGGSGVSRGGSAGAGGRSSSTGSASMGSMHGGSPSSAGMSAPSSAGGSSSGGAATGGHH